MLDSTLGVRLRSSVRVGGAGRVVLAEVSASGVVLADVLKERGTIVLSFGESRVSVFLMRRFWTI